MSAIISTPLPTGNETHREDVLEVLELRLVANARDQIQMTHGDPGVDRVVGDELSHVSTVTALAPDVANLDQDTVVVDNPSQLKPRLQRLIVQQAEQPMDRDNLHNNPSFVRLVKSLSDSRVGVQTVDPTTLLIGNCVTVSKDRIKDPRSCLPSPGIPLIHAVREGRFEQRNTSRRRIWEPIGHQGSPICTYRPSGMCIPQEGASQ